VSAKANNKGYSLAVLRSPVWVGCGGTAYDHNKQLAEFSQAAVLHSIRFLHTIVATQ
jgi:hypothetical protein